MKFVHIRESSIRACKESKFTANQTIFYLRSSYEESRSLNKRSCPLDDWGPFKNQLHDASKTLGAGENKWPHALADHMIQRLIQKNA